MEASLQTIRLLRLFAANATYIRMHSFLLWFVERLYKIHEINIGSLDIYDTPFNDDTLLVDLQFDKLEFILVFDFDELLSIGPEVFIVLGVEVYFIEEVICNTHHYFVTECLEKFFSAYGT
jgi:hypothetical protein